MKALRLIPVILFFTISSTAQTVCGTANENGSVTLTAPVGNVFTSIEFASYGTPNGACGTYTIGTCHAANSATIAGNTFIGRNTATLAASNGVFGDPCNGTLKRLYILARYSTVLPLTLISFTAQQAGTNKVKLDWGTADEMNTATFQIEAGADGSVFETVGTLAAAGSGKNAYQYVHEDGLNSGTYYRLKMVDLDGRHTYSNVIRVNGRQQAAALQVFPSPADDRITITSGKRQPATICNLSGRVMKTLTLMPGSQGVNITDLMPGVYIVRTDEGVVKFVKK